MPEINELEEFVCSSIQCINAEVVDDVLYIPATVRSGIPTKESLTFTIRAGGDQTYVVRAYDNTAQEAAKKLKKGSVVTLDAILQMLPSEELKMCLIAKEIVV